MDTLQNQHIISTELSLPFATADTFLVPDGILGERENDDGRLDDQMEEAGSISDPILCGQEE